MKFFVPLVDPAEAETCYRAFARFIGASAPSRHSDRIATLDWLHSGRQLHAAVGKALPLAFGPDGEPVLAIFDAGDYYFICTASRGGAMGRPIVAAKAGSSIATFD